MATLPMRENNTLATLASLFVPKGTTTTSTGGGSTETTSSNVSPEAINEIVKQLMSNPNNGLAAVSSGQRQAGIYNGTTNQLLTNDLISRVAGQAAALNKTETRTRSDNTTSKVKTAAPIKPGVGAGAIGLLQLIPKQVKDRITDSVLGTGSSSAQSSGIKLGASGSGSNLNPNQEAYSFGGPSTGVYAQDGFDMSYIDSIQSATDTLGSDIDLDTMLGGGSFVGDDIDLSFLDEIVPASDDLSGAVLDDAFWDDILFADGGEVKSEKSSDKDKPREISRVFGGMLQKAIKDLLQTQKRREDAVDKYADGGLVNTGTYGGKKNTAASNTVDANIISAPDITNPMLISALKGAASNVANTAVSQSQQARAEIEASGGNNVEGRNPNETVAGALDRSQGNPMANSVASSVAGVAPGLAVGALGLGPLGSNLANRALQAMGIPANGILAVPSAMISAAYRGQAATQDINNAKDPLGAFIGALNAGTPGIAGSTASLDMETAVAGANAASRLGQIDGISALMGITDNFANSPGPASPSTSAEPTGADTTSLSSNADGLASFANGGEIRGKGTGTSDSIPAKVSGSGRPIKVSNGEYILPKDIVDMLGVDALDQLVATFHTPVNRRM